MRFAILDCYTDEPSGLGVPPYIGTYPRYIYGSIIKNNHTAYYLTIDDLRNYIKPRKNTDIAEDIKTDIKRFNFSKNTNNIQKILESINYLIIVSGVQTPGKYLSAQPGTVKEVKLLLDEVNIKIKNNYKTILSGPGAEIGEGLYGGKRSTSRNFDSYFDYVIKDLDYKLDDFLSESLITALNENSSTKKTCLEYSKINNNAIYGAKLLDQINDVSLNKIAEIETMKGCKSKQSCSFCTEKLKNPQVFRREPKEIIEEIKALNKHGIKNFRLGKQTCFYSYGKDEEIKKLLISAKKYSNILHLDNVNPHFVTEEKTKIICENMTSGNLAAFGIESFDEKVIKKNNLNTNPEESFNAIKIINKYGKKTGENGAPHFLPGINILFGLNEESKKTHEENMFWLNKIKESNLLLRRINIREVVVFENTLMDKTCKTKYIKKNKKHYWSWRNQIRQEIDIPMLQKTFPKNTILKDLYTEIYDGNTTFARQVGSYPIAVGIKQRLPLKQKINVKIEDYMKRSLVATKYSD